MNKQKGNIFYLVLNSKSAAKVEKHIKHYMNHKVITKLNGLDKLSSLIKSEWNSQELKTEVENLVKEHYKITKDLNSLDENNSIL